MVWSHTSVEFEHEILLHPLIQDGLKRYQIVSIPDLCTITYFFCVSYKQRYVHEVLANPLIKHDQEKMIS